MTSSIVACALVTVTLLSDVSALEWDPDGLGDNREVYGCVGYDVTLNWTLSLTSQAETVVVSWHKGGVSGPMIAMSYNGLLSVTSPYSGRVERAGNAGIVLQDAAFTDSGLYYVSVFATFNNSNYVALNRTARVVLGDGLMTEDGRLHAKQRLEAVYDVSTRDWRVALQCGTFLFRHAPPFNVNWVDPDGQRVPSDKYLNGQFLLLLDSFESGQVYTCYVPPSSAHSVCIGNSSLVNASANVDQFKARLTLLEARERQLTAKVGDLEAEKQALGDTVASIVNKTGDNEARERQLKAKVEVLEGHVTVLERSVTHLEAENHALGETLDNFKNTADRRFHDNEAHASRLKATVTSNVARLYDVISEVRRVPIAFHAKVYPTFNGQGVIHPYSWSLNLGNAFNGSTGVFTAPRNGLYYFAVTAGTDRADATNYLSLVRGDGLAVAASHTQQYGKYSTMGGVTVVMKLAARTTLSLYSSGPGPRFWSSVTTFSGFLIYDSARVRLT